MRQEALYVKKYGALGSEFYHALQREAAAGSVVSRIRRKMLRAGLPVPPKPRRCP
jgi:hypothetical protein